MSYPEAQANPDFPWIEREIIKKWTEDRTFEASIERRPRTTRGKSNEFVFYDGPPFANGLPHSGHLATGFVKDLVSRYQIFISRTYRPGLDRQVHVDSRSGQ
jgi:isoleucyl-tRNA synthetase